MNTRPQFLGLLLTLMFLSTSSLAYARYYDSMAGRFISRDPAGYGDGKNLYQYVGNQPTMKADPKGMWGANVHYMETLTWGVMLRTLVGSLTVHTAGIIATADQAIDDNWGSGVTPVVGDLGRHMDTGGESQMTYWYNHRSEASRNIQKADCAWTKRGAKKYCEKAAEEFGKGLHSLQDTSSHRPYPFDDGRWPTLRIHPNWWDYYGPLPTADANTMGGYSGLKKKEIEEQMKWWADNGIWGTDYDIWRNSPEQISSQQKAIEKVKKDTNDELRVFLWEIGQSCICKKYLMK